MQFKDLTGQRFGRLIVIGRALSRSGVTRWQVQCNCGKTLDVCGTHLRGGRTKSCGCLGKSLVGDRSRTHGWSRTGTYRSWQSAYYRCTNPNSISFPNYGARGITMCDRWVSSFENFLADMGERPKGMSLERKEVNGNYEPDNCEWATRSVQSINRRDRKQYLLGDSWLTLTQLQKHLNIKQYPAQKKAKTLPYRYVGTTEIKEPTK